MVNFTSIKNLDILKQSLQTETYKTTQCKLYAKSFIHEYFNKALSVGYLYKKYVFSFITLFQSYLNVIK